jgi:hypothetical protein
MKLALWLAALALLSVATVAKARDPAQVHRFRRDHPCPATGKTDGPCPGWLVDHAYPLCAGGKDEPANMQWQDARQSYLKDRIERELCACKGGRP